MSIEDMINRYNLKHWNIHDLTRYIQENCKRDGRPNPVIIQLGHEQNYRTQLNGIFTDDELKMIMVAQAMERAQMRG